MAKGLSFQSHGSSAGSLAFVRLTTINSFYLQNPFQAEVIAYVLIYIFFILGSRGEGPFEIFSKTA